MRPCIPLGAGLLAVGLLAALPFMSRGLVGTGEAYNYSLSVADAATQMRAGVVPPLAGQTGFAFNGRIHPLRDAPYLHYLAAAIDIATLRRLSFWELQNASLAASLVAAVFACYFGLRWATGCTRSAAFLLAAAYGLSAPILSAAHEFDLFMTVHAAVFVPLAVAACLRGCREPSFSTDAWLAAALAGAWLAHPPVALWLTASVALVRMLAFLRRPSWRVVWSAAGAALLFSVLAGFVFASAATLRAGLGNFAMPEVVRRGFADLILDKLRSAFPGELLPVSRRAGELGDLQFGYVPWALVALTLFLLLRRSGSPAVPERESRFGAGASVLVSVLLLLLVLPVPFLTHWLWGLLPGPVLEITSEWPMQRLYLVAVAFAVFGAAIVLPTGWRELSLPAWSAPAAIAAGALWTLIEAEPFILRGLHNRWTEAATQSAFRESNVDLTITSYSFVGPPPTFNHGVVDPQFEFRILREGEDAVASNLSAALATAPVVDRGELRAAPGPGAPVEAVSKKLTLLPGHRYLLAFVFRTPPARGVIEIKGPMLHRNYILPSAGGDRGFGMLEGQRRAVPLWTDSDSPEAVEIWFHPADAAVLLGRQASFANFTLRDVDREALPVRLKGLLPLRFSVEAPEAGCTVETPRRFLAGYEATVNGVKVSPVISPYRQVMIPVPRGQSDVELHYAGPPLVRAAFWLSAFSWAAFFIWRAAGSRRIRVPTAAFVRPLAGLAGAVSRHKGLSAGAVLAILGLAALAVRFERRQAVLRGVGPVRIEFVLPVGKKDINQPLLATGRRGAGVVVFATLIDGAHIRIGADVWGRLFQSGPIEVDPFWPQALVVSDSALYPPDHPKVRALDPATRDRLRNTLRIELNGKVAIEETAYGYESELPDILVGEARFGSVAGPRFLGRIDSAERLPIPQALPLPRGRHAVMRVRFPLGREGASEPLLSARCGPGGLTLYATYGAEGKLRISSVGADGIPVQSGELTIDPDASHELVLRAGRPADANHSFELACTLDGARVLGRQDTVAPDAPLLLQSGLNDLRAAGVDARFTGPQMELSTEPDSPGRIAPGTSAPLHLVLMFPKGRSGRHEPILTSGRTGAGDFIYVVYEDEGHVRIGFDHWGGAGALSELIPVDYLAPHELLIFTGALYPDLADDRAWGGLDPALKKSLKSHVAVILDGRTVLSSATATHPSAPAAVTVARNAIGGSSADPEFTGTLQFVERMDGASRVAPETQGPLRLVLTFPSDKAGRREPLLTSGRKGAGDVIYAVYEDARHVRLGFDHWGETGTLSEPIPVDYLAPHELLIDTGALYPEESDGGAWEGLSPALRPALKSHVTVVLDGKRVLSAATRTYPSARSEITVARNTIGGSWADPEFSGTLEAVERMGLSARQRD